MSARPASIAAVEVVAGVAAGVVLSAVVAGTQEVAMMWAAPRRVERVADVVGVALQAMHVVVVGIVAVAVAGIVAVAVAFVPFPADSAAASVPAFHQPHPPLKLPGRSDGGAAFGLE